MPRCCQTFLAILLLDVVLIVLLPFSLLLGPGIFYLLLLLLMLAVPLLAARDGWSSVTWLSETGSHNRGAALVRLACGGSLAFLVFASILEAFRGHEQVGLLFSLFLVYCMTQMFRLMGGAAVNLLLCLGSPFYCRTRADWQWTLACALTSLAGAWVVQRPQPELFSPEVAGIMREVLSRETLLLVLWCLSSFVYGLMWGGCLHYVGHKSLGTRKEP